MKQRKEHKEHKNRKSSKKKRDKDIKHKKEHRKSRKRHSSSSSSSDSDSGHAGRGSALTQLEKERAAVQAARYILATQPGIRKNFRDLLWELDNGRAAGVSGIPDVVLRSQLQFTLEHLGLKCTKGQYWLPSGAPTTLSVIGFVFDELPRQHTAAPQGMMTVEAAAEPPPAAEQPQPAAAGQPAGPVMKGPQLPQQQQQQQASAKEQQQAAQDVEMPSAVGPAAKPESQQQQEQQPSDSEAGDNPGQLPEPVGPAPRRVVGPAAPPAELLAAAAAYHAEVEASGGYEAAAAGPSADQDTGAIIGPPPPAYIDEADAAPADAREAQVIRVLNVLREAAVAGPVTGPSSTAGPAPAAQPSTPSADPYAVLGVEPTADAGAIRKCYWRLSLLVHPDKCSHPAAQEVFQAVSKAAQLLQDAEQRKQLDEQKADAVLRQQALAAAAAAEREVAWRRARGEAVPADLAAALAAAKSAGAGPAARESWMTDLPTNQGKTAAQALAMGLAQTSQSSFSRFGVRQPGDTSGWTDTPEQRAMRAAGLLTDSNTAARPALPAGPAVEGSAVTAELAAAMSEYAQKHRHKSLLEQHAEQQAQGGKKKSKEKRDKDKDKEKSKDGKGQKRKAEGDVADGDWEGKHPWKPWDRDKDLEVQLQRPKAAADLLKAAGNLSSRFSSGR